MTDFHKQVEGEVAISRRMLMWGRLLTLVGFQLFVLPAVMPHSQPLLLVLIPIGAVGTFVGLALWLRALRRLQTRILCPDCGNRLDYLIEGQVPPGSLRLPASIGDLPADIEKCPVCHYSLTDKEERRQNKVSHVTSQ
jgi:hypothetical protein